MKIPVRHLKKQRAFLKALSVLLSSENPEVVLRDLAEAQSLIRSHPDLVNDEFKKDQLASTLHEVERTIRQIQPYG
jgi:hypothetical protein